MGKSAWLQEATDTFVFTTSLSGIVSLTGLVGQIVSRGRLKPLARLACKLSDRSICVALKMAFTGLK